MVQFGLIPCPPPPPLGIPPGTCNFFLSWWLIPLPQERTRRHFPTPELLIDLMYVFCGVHQCSISIQQQNETFAELL